MKWLFSHQRTLASELKLSRIYQCSMAFSYPIPGVSRPFSQVVFQFSQVVFQFIGNLDNNEVLIKILESPIRDQINKEIRVSKYNLFRIHEETKDYFSYQLKGNFKFFKDGYQ